MRLGCSGCLTGLAVGTLGTLLLAGAVSAVFKMVALPDEDRPALAAADGTRAQRKLMAVTRRGHQAQTVTLSEAEVNALLGNQLGETGRPRFTDLHAHLLGDDRLELRALTPLGSVLDEVGLEAVKALLPTAWSRRPVRLRAGARLHVEEGAPRQLRLTVDELEIGRQRLPVLALRLLVDAPTLGALHWRLPDHVERVAVEPGRLLIRTVPGR